MKKKIGFSIFALALVVSAISFSGKAYDVEAASQLDSQLSGVQVRSGKQDDISATDSNWIVLLDSSIDPLGVSTSIGGSKYNAPDYVNIYLSKNADPVKLRDVIDETKLWDVNLFSTGGVMFHISDETLETYNGKSIYAIEVLEGCTYPDAHFNKLIVQETVRYINGDYNKESARYLSCNWFKAFTPSDRTITLKNCQMRADTTEGVYYLSVVSSAYSGQSFMNYPGLSELNTFNKIKLYKSAEDTAHYLADVTELREGAQNKWNSGSLLIGMTSAEYDVYNGTTTYKVEIEAGCEFVVNNQIVRTDREYVFTNIDYGKDEVKNGAYFFIYNPPITEPISIFDVQVRADIGQDYYGIVLRSTFYTDVAEMTRGFDGEINTYSKIKIYLNDSNDGVTLSDVTTYRMGIQNLWNSEGMFFRFTESEFDTYNGTTIKKIEILEGCQLIVNTNIVTTSRRYSFVNTEYGQVSAKYEAFRFSPEADELVQLGEVELSCVHNRMDSASGYRWIMLLTSEEIFETNLQVSDWMNNINLLDNILIYFSKNGTPITLRSIYDPSATGVTIKLFGSGNLIGISISNEMFASKYRYGGPEMYRITIKEGTQIPNLEDGVAGYRLITKEVSFINDDYRKYGDIPNEKDEFGNNRKYEEWNINWRIEIENYVNLGEITITALHNRMDRTSEQRWLMLIFESPIYNVMLNVTDWTKDLNLLKNIHIYFSEDDKSPIVLKDIFDPNATGVTLGLFGGKNILGISINNVKDGTMYRNCGPNMFKIVIDGGTQIPTYENGVSGYRLIKQKMVLINNDYKKFGDIEGSLDDYGLPRIYEEWSINWSIASCLVTFKVEGIEGLVYPDLLLDYGQRVSLEKYEIEGYELTVRTSDNETIYQNIVGTNHNIEVILIYKSTKSEYDGLNGWQRFWLFMKKIRDAIIRQVSGGKKTGLKLIFNNILSGKGE